MTLDSLPDLEYKRVVSCKDSFHGTDVLAVSEHVAPGRRPNIHTQFVGRQMEDGLDTLPARAAEANRSTLIADIPFPALETSQPSGASCQTTSSEAPGGSGPQWRPKKCNVLRQWCACDPFEIIEQ